MRKVIVGEGQRKLEGEWTHEVVMNEIEFHPDVGDEITKALIKHVEDSK